MGKRKAFFCSDPRCWGVRVPNTFYAGQDPTESIKFYTIFELTLDCDKIRMGSRYSLLPLSLALYSLILLYSGSDKNQQYYLNRIAFSQL